MIDKNKIMSITIAFIVCLVMIGLTRIPAYVSAMNNWFFIILLLFFITLVFGFGIYKLFFWNKVDKK